MDVLGVFGIDGVLANGEHRAKLYAANKFTEYFSAKRMLKDSVYEEGRLHFKIWKSQPHHKHSYLTARREDTRPQTEEWLAKNGFEYGILGMRSLDDLRPAALIKRDYLLEASAGWDLVYLFDDDPEVIKVVGELERVIPFYCTWYRKPESMITRVGGAR